MRIGIYGGSFDPVHAEHVNSASGVYEAADLDKLIVVPALNPPHRRGEKRADFSDRINMLKLAFGDSAEISDFEADGDGYTFHTLEYFSEKYPAAELFFMVGTDMLADFPSWRKPERILELATLAVTVREGEDFPAAERAYKEKFNKKIFVSTYIGKRVSSTKIKAYLRLGVPTGDMLDSQVLEYIHSRGLYRGDRAYEYVRKTLPEKRLRHTANVIALATKYAKKFGESIEKAELAALLHDVAKYMEPKDFRGAVFPSAPSQIMHQFMGGYLAKNQLGISDEEVLSAITYHTTGRPNMSKLEKIVFLADLLEDDREYSDVNNLRRITESGLDEGMRAALISLVSHLKKTQTEIYPLTIEAARFYGAEV